MALCLGESKKADPLFLMRETTIRRATRGLHPLQINTFTKLVLASTDDGPCTSTWPLPTIAAAGAYQLCTRQRPGFTPVEARPTLAANDTGRPGVPQGKGSSVSELAGEAGYLLELGLLKRARRSGWWIAGIRDPESIAEHSWRTAIVGMIIASREGADPVRTSMLCSLHDVHETRIGDIPKIGKHYLTATDSETITADQTTECGDPTKQMLRDATAEYEAGQTIEAACARDADKLECLIQAVEYQHQGVTTVKRWIDSSLAAMKTDTARALANAILDANPLAWENTRAES